MLCNSCLLFSLARVAPVKNKKPVRVDSLAANLFLFQRNRIYDELLD